MILDGKDHLIHLLLGQVEPLEYALHAFGARMNMITFVMAMRFTNVVEQQGQQQKLGMRELVQNDAEAMIRWQFLDVTNCDQRVLVNGVLVEEVANDAATNFFELREDPSKKTDLVHRQQCLVYPAPVFHHGEHGLAGGHITAQINIRS